MAGEASSGALGVKVDWERNLEDVTQLGIGKEGMFVKILPLVMAARQCVESTAKNWIKKNHALFSECRISDVQWTGEGQAKQPVRSCPVSAVASVLKIAATQKESHAAARGGGAPMTEQERDGAAQQSDTDLGAWEKKYSEAADVIAVRMKVGEMGDELKGWKSRWPADLESPTLPPELTRCADSSKVKKYWSQPLSKWPQTALASDKTRMSHLLAADRRSMFAHDTSQVPPPPSVATSKEKVNTELIKGQLSKHSLLRGVRACNTSSDLFP